MAVRLEQFVAPKRPSHADDSFGCLKIVHVLESREPESLHGLRHRRIVLALAAGRFQQRAVKPDLGILADDAIDGEAVARLLDRTRALVRETQTRSR